MAIAQPHPTDEIRPMVDIDNDYPQRADRLYDVPCAQNAQGLFSPEACLFVGNLSTRVPAEKLSTDLEALFSRFGRCHVKIKYDGRRRLPTAFLQFEKVQDAKEALRRNSDVYLHNRQLRVEKAKGRRTCVLGLRSGAPITEELLFEAINKRGPIEAYAFQHEMAFTAWGECYSTITCIVTFAYVQDCLEAIQHFENCVKFYMHLEPVTGSPLLSQTSSPNSGSSKMDSGVVAVKVNWRSSQSQSPNGTTPSKSTPSTRSTLSTTASSDTWDCEVWRYPKAPLTPDQQRKTRPRSPSQPPKVVEEGIDENDNKIPIRRMRPVARLKRSYSI